MLVGQPLRNTTGQIVDFQLVKANPAALALTGLSADAVSHRTVLDLDPDIEPTGFFRRCVAVVERGEAFQAERSFGENWYTVSVVRVGEDCFLSSFLKIEAQKNAELRAQQTADLLQGVLDATPLALNHLEAVFDESDNRQPADFEFRVVNPASERIGGQPASELIGHRLTERYPNVIETGVFEQYLTVWRTGQPWQAELPYDGDGLTGWFSFLVNKHGNGLVTVINDISERKRAELRQTELASQLQVILDHTPVGLALLNAVRDEAGGLADMDVVLVNNSTARLVLLPGEDMVGQRMFTLFPGLRTNPIWEHFYKPVVDGRQSQTFETHYEGEGIDAWFRVGGTPYGDGILLTVDDITDRKRAELRQAELAAQLQAVLDNTPVGVGLMRAVRDKAGELVDLEWKLVNNSTARTVLLPGENMIGQRFLEQFPNVRPAGLWDVFYKKTIETGQPQELETFYEGEGIKGWFRLEGTSLGDGMLLTMTDITDRKRAELEVTRQSDLLRNVLDAAQVNISTFEAVRNEAGGLIDFRYGLANERAAVSTGMTVADLQGRGLVELFPGVKPSGLFDRYRRVWETGQAERFELHYPYDGFDNYNDVYAAPFGTDGLIISYSNITELKLSQRVIEQQSDEYRHILDNALTAISHFEAIREGGKIVDFRYKSFNRMSETITGMTAAQVVGQRMLRLFPGVHTSGVFERWVTLVETGEPVRFHDRYTHDGFDFWFDTQAVKWGDGFIQSYLDVTPIIRVQQAQQQQAELFNGVIENTLSGIIRWESVRNEAGQIADFRASVFNRTVIDLTGITPELLQTRTFLELDPEGLFESYVGVVETGQSLRVEHCFANRWFDVTAARVGDGFVVSFTDISPVRESVRERQQQVAQQQVLLDGSINGILALESVRDKTGTLVDFIITAGNRAVEIILGRPLEKLVGERIQTVYPGVVETGIFARYAETVETGRSQRFEVYYHADDLDTWFDISTTPQSHGLIITFIDISQAKRAQQALVGEAILFQTLSSQVPEAGALVVDTGQRVLFANGELPALFTNPDQSRLPGKRLSDVLRNDFRPGVPTALRQALAGALQQESMQIGEAWYEVFYSPVRNAQGAVVMAMATFRNVTRDRLYQQRLQATNENLERFAYVASHDLQEPLRKIQSFGDMLFRRQAAKLDESSLDLIRRMQAAATRMNELIRDLLTFSRFSVAQQEPFEPLALDKLVADVRNDLEVVIREKGAILHVDALPSVQGDALQLRQLFQNMISNALKFTRPGVPPRVELRYRLINGADAPLLANLPPGGLFHEISISDNGIGFEEQYAQRIFEAFQRLHGRGEYPGTGIGLAIVKKVVENHHGGLFVSSQPGEGSTFVVYLPVDENRGR